MSASAPAKKSRYRSAIMSLDMRGRLVADMHSVFAYGPIKAEINAAKALGKALADAKAKKRGGKPNRNPPR